MFDILSHTYDLLVKAFVPVLNSLQPKVIMLLHFRMVINFIAQKVL